MTAPNTSLTGASAQERETDKAFSQVACELHEAAIELAQYASYSEYTGQIRGNNPPFIRKWCDEVFRLHHEFQRVALAARGAAVPDAGAEALSILARRITLECNAEASAADIDETERLMRAALSAIPAAPAQTESEAYREGMMRAAEIADEAARMPLARVVDAGGAIRAEAASAVPSAPVDDTMHLGDLAVYVSSYLEDDAGFKIVHCNTEDAHLSAGDIRRAADSTSLLAKLHSVVDNIAQEEGVSRDKALAHAVRFLREHKSNSARVETASAVPSDPRGDGRRNLLIRLDELILEACQFYGAHDAEAIAARVMLGAGNELPAPPAPGAKP